LNCGSRTGQRLAHRQTEPLLSGVRRDSVEKSSNTKASRAPWPSVRRHAIHPVIWLRRLTIAVWIRETVSRIRLAFAANWSAV
jgi:hypothetical protein